MNTETQSENFNMKEFILHSPRRCGKVTLNDLVFVKGTLLGGVPKAHNKRSNQSNKYHLRIQKKWNRAWFWKEFLSMETVFLYSRDMRMGAYFTAAKLMTSYLNLRPEKVMKALKCLS